MNMSEKSYLKGSAKEITTEYGTLLSVSLNIDDLKQYANDKGWINFTITQRRETDQYGNTHTCYYKPYEPKNKKEEINVDDIPFR